MLLTILLALVTAAGAVEDHGYRPIFHAQDCQDCLFDHAADLHRQLERTLGDRRRAAVAVERALVAFEPGEDFALDDPRFIWFTAPGTEDVRSVKTRANEAAHRGAARLDQRPTPTFTTRAPDAPLTARELSTLGLPEDLSVTPADVVGRVTVRGNGWLVELVARGGVVARFELPLADVEAGYTNAVYEWQWMKIADADRRDQPIRLVSPLDFIVEHAHVMFTRAVADRRIGYVLRSYPRPAGGVVTQLEIAWLRPVRRRASSTSDLVFPRADDQTAAGEAPPLHWTVCDLGLRLVLAPTPTPE